MVPIIIRATELRTLKSSLARRYRLPAGSPISTRGMSTDLETLAPLGFWEINLPARTLRWPTPPCRQGDRAGAPPGPRR